jgi:predicted DNA-binding transcriptional regulator AlpA
MGRTVAVEDLIGATTVASMLGLAHSNSVATYLHRYVDFPRPVFDRPLCKVWSRNDVAEWITAHQRRRGQ